MTTFIFISFRFSSLWTGSNYFYFVYFPICIAFLCYIYIYILLCILELHFAFFIRFLYSFVLLFWFSFKYQYSSILPWSDAGIATGKLCQDNLPIRRSLPWFEHPHPKSFFFFFLMGSITEPTSSYRTFKMSAFDIKLTTNQNSPFLLEFSLLVSVFSLANTWRPSL